MTGFSISSSAILPSASSPWRRALHEAFVLGGHERGSVAKETVQRGKENLLRLDSNLSLPLPSAPLPSALLLPGFGHTLRWGNNDRTRVRATSAPRTGQAVHTVPRCALQTHQVAFPPRQVVLIACARPIRLREGASREDLGTARMKSRLLHILLAVGVVVVTMLTAFTIPASAEQRVIYVKLATGRSSRSPSTCPGTAGPDRAPRHARAARLRPSSRRRRRSRPSLRPPPPRLHRPPPRAASASPARKAAPKKSKRRCAGSAGAARAPAGLGLDPRVSVGGASATATRCAGRTEAPRRATPASSTRCRAPRPAAESRTS